MQAKAKEVEANSDDRERMHAALGASTPPLPGSSPPGSFESELLTFMRNTPQSRTARASRRSKRRRSSPADGFGWRHGMHLRRAATPGQHGLRSLLGLWAVCAQNTADRAHFVELTVQVASGGTLLRGTKVGGLQSSTLFVAETSFSSRSMSSSSEFWQKRGDAIEDAVQWAFSDSAIAAESLTNRYIAPGGIETERWSEVVERIGLQFTSGSGESVPDLSPEVSVDAIIDIAGLTNNMSLDGDLSEVQWQVERVLTAVNRTDGSLVSTVVEVVFHSSSAQRVLVLFGSDDEYQIMKRIELP
jgi:hypothetical protein